MNSNDLKKLSKIQLLELLLEKSKENEELREQLNLKSKQLESKQLMLNEAGSIANAALKLNGVFEAAEAAAAQYLNNIKQLSERQNEVCARIEAEARKKANDMLIAAQAKCIAREKEADEYVAEVSKKLEAFYNNYQDLYDILQKSVRKDNNG